MLSYMLLVKMLMLVNLIYFSSRAIFLVTEITRISLMSHGSLNNLLYCSSSAQQYIEIYEHREHIYQKFSYSKLNNKKKLLDYFDKHLISCIQNIS